MKVRWTRGRMKDGGGDISGRWDSECLRKCEQCGLEWEDSQENESCPMAELEAEFLPYAMEYGHEPWSPVQVPVSCHRGPFPSSDSLLCWNRMISE